MIIVQIKKLKRNILSAYPGIHTAKFKYVDTTIKNKITNRRRLKIIRFKLKKKLLTIQVGIFCLSVRYLKRYSKLVYNSKARMLGLQDSFLHEYMYIYTYIHTYPHYIHTNIHTCIHTHIHTYIT